MAHGGPRVQSTAPPSSGTPPAHLHPTQFYTHCPLAFGMCQPLGTACHLYRQEKLGTFPRGGPAVGQPSVGHGGSPRWAWSSAPGAESSLDSRSLQRKVPGPHVAAQGA